MYLLHELVVICIGIRCKAHAYACQYDEDFPVMMDDELRKALLWHGESLTKELGEESNEKNSSLSVEKRW
ncbi:hypothetical protein HSBAA_01410 [Vreelandella sulfidaeris]|uniref:Uncharacterized protein n=1 Tax=Vreelandella sulfidaeris TaxID=115553 RepID=A0A455TZT5_9GAMM|nr:hypothetical protein HSBAA_01410 [Halomonas sulfidaeris]